jgi:tripartite ATP-independent transporter DctP family solute receptor
MFAAAISLTTPITTTAAAAEVIRLGSCDPEATLPIFLGHQLFAKRVAELTNGQIEVRIFMNSQLGGGTKLYEQVAAGTLELGECGSGFTSSYDKRFSIWSLPYMVPSAERLFEAQDGKLGQAYGALSEKYGFKLVEFFYAGSRSLFNRKGPVRVPEDIKKMGLRCRVMPDPLMIDTLNAMGCRATPMELGEIYKGIQQGVIDGADQPITGYLAMKFNEVAPFFSLTHTFYAVDPVLASLKWFNQQKPEIQKALLQAGKEAVAFERNAYIEADQKSYETAKGLGVKINEVDIPAFQKIVRPVVDKYGAALGELYPILKEYQ